jgi:hypothetical protein
MSLHDDTVDEAADTLRFARHAFDTDPGADPDATSCYVLCDRAAALWRLIEAARQNIERLREALASGWDIGPELAYEERRLATLEAASHGP